MLPSIYSVKFCLIISEWMSHLNLIMHFSDPCFNSGENLTGLARGDAEFVVAIHSNAGALGKRDPLGK